jgi:hypothetical protein
MGTIAEVLVFFVCLCEMLQVLITVLLLLGGVGTLAYAMLSSKCNY